ncbi:hypothetical protein KGF57_004984 [Candida theae]|uniref:CBS domain-containing protein n=1 Tax=Candida theae TaxID=1198502 RepID=A0AAD5BA00_9ASCO|nr:uncharacterized protein KGF57_004984 [Candida theae]KAI5949022.1 hypothetical protein KGF57_004984 [Candida theae]
MFTTPSHTLSPQKSSPSLTTTSTNYHQSDLRKRQSKRDEAIRRRIEHDLSKKKKNGSKVTRHKKAIPGTVLSLKPSDPIICKTTATVHEVSQMMTATRENCVLVVNDVGELLGIFTAKDLAFRIVGSGLTANSVTIDQIMTANPICANANNPASEALNLMVEKGFRHLPVLDNDNQIVGVLDITKCYAQQMEKLERMHAQSKTLYDAWNTVHNEIGVQDQPQHVFQYFETLKNKMNGPTLEHVLDETTEPIYVSVKTSVYEATVLMRENKTTAVLVKDTNQEVTGIFTSKDVVLRVIAAGLDPKNCSVVRVMTSHPDVAHTNLPIQQALRKMFEGHYLNLPVVNNDDDIIGMVDVLKLTYATLTQIKQLEAKDLPSSLDAPPEQGNEGPAWNKFWTSLDDTESVHSDSLMDESAAANAPDITQSEFQSFNVEIKPSDSISHADGSPNKDSTAAGSVSNSVQDDLPYIFKFKSPAIEGRVHRITLKPSDGVLLLRKLIHSKLNDNDFAKLNVSKPNATEEDSSSSLARNEEVAVSYIDDEGDVVSITTDTDLIECVRINKRLGNEKADLYLHNPHSHPSVEEVKSVRRGNKPEPLVTGIANEVLVPGVLAVLASSIIIGFTLSRK